jgi:hypothetical protein
VHINLCLGFGCGTERDPNRAFKIFRDVYGENYNYAGVELEVMFPD